MLKTSVIVNFASTRRRVKGLAALALLALLVTSSGCEFGRQWFQMSSDSMPFFGIDLLPRRGSTRSIAAGENDELSIQTADDRPSDRTAFEPRIIATRDSGSAAPAEHRDPIELSDLSGRSNESETEADTFGDPFPEPIRLSGEE